MCGSDDCRDSSHGSRLLQEAWKVPVEITAKAYGDGEGRSRLLPLVKCTLDGVWAIWMELYLEHSGSINHIIPD
jgi:hypothetical protein